MFQYMSNIYFTNRFCNILTETDLGDGNRWIQTSWFGKLCHILLLVYTVHGKMRLTEILYLRAVFNKFQDFFWTGIIFCRRLLQILYVIAIHLMRWLTNFYDFRFKWTAAAGIGIQTTKARLSQLVKFRNAIWTWRHFKRTFAIKLCFKLAKNATETYGMLQTAFGAFCMNRASVFEWHKRFKEGRDSVRDEEKCGASKEINTPELIGQRVRVRVTMLRF